MNQNRITFKQLKEIKMGKQGRVGEETEWKGREREETERKGRGRGESGRQGNKA